MKRSLYVVFFCFSSLFLSCESSEGTEDEVPPSFSYGTETYVSKLGTLRLRIQAPLQESYLNGDVHFNQGLFVAYYDDNQSISATLKADTGYYSAKEELYRVTGNAVLQNLKKKERLETKKLLWHVRKKRITTDQKVRILTDGEIHSGTGLDASEDFEEYRIIEPSGTLNVGE